MLRYAIALFVSIFSLLSAMAQSQPKTLLFVGSYTNDKAANGITVFSFDSQSGALKKLSQAENIVNPSYLALSPNGRFLYACCDTQKPIPGSIAAFSIDHASGKLSLLNKQPSGGDNPVYVEVDQSNRFLVTGNYSSGTVSLLYINKQGRLLPKTETIAFKDSSINRSRQEKSHIHSTFFDPTFRYIFAPDLGADKIWAFSFSRDRKPHLILRKDLTVKTTPGSGPRHFAFHPNHKFGYLIEELTGTISAYTYTRGHLTPTQKIFSYARPRDSYGAADIHISPDGRFLYASNRFVGENTIAIFSIDTKKDGKLTLVGHQSTEGDHPRNFTIDPTGNFLLVANMLSNNIVVFKRNAETGLLTKVGEEKSVSKPSCLQMRTYQ